MIEKTGDLRIKVKQKEWYPVILSFIYFMCILCAYYVIRPIRDQLAAEVGSVELPWFFLATLAATLLLTPIFGWLVSNYPRKVIMPLVYFFFIVGQLFFVPIFEESFISTCFLGALFFVWVSVFNLFIVSVFWSFMSDIWSDEQAKRLFPVIALGGTIGAIIGPILTRSLVAIIGSSLLLVVSAALLLIAVLCILLLGKWAHDFGVHRFHANHESAIGGGMWDGLKQIFNNSFIAGMSIIMLLNDAIGTISYALVADYSGSTFINDSIAQTRFAATMDLASNVLQVVLQLTITRLILVRYGPKTIFALVSVLVVIACLSMSLVQNPFIPLIGIMPSVALVLILTRSLSHGMLQPAREMLYTLVPRDLRYKGKNAVDTVVWRTGDVLSLLSINAFKALGVNVVGFGVIWAIFAATSGYIGWYLSKQVENGDFEESKP